MYDLITITAQGVERICNILIDQEKFHERVLIQITDDLRKILQWFSARSVEEHR
jgi:hypothetical protein